MVNLLIQGIFFVVTKLFDVILTPFIASLTALFPDLSNIFAYITTFLNYCIEYLVTVCKLCLVPQRCFNSTFYLLLCLIICLYYNEFNTIRYNCI